MRMFPARIPAARVRVAARAAAPILSILYALTAAALPAAAQQNGVAAGTPAATHRGAVATRPATAPGRAAGAAGPSSPQAADTAYTRMIGEYTTDPHFLPSSVESLPVDPGLPSPLEHFGTIVGAPGVMHHADEVYGYFRALAKASPRVSVEKVGTTEEGRDIDLVVIADEQTMQHLDRYRTDLARLADPRGMSDAEAERVLADAKPIYYLNAGLHSPEMGSPEMVMELAYRLAGSDAPAVKNIRDHVITLINPVSEPDGRDRQVDWYLHYTKGRKEFDDGFPRSSPYWGHYVVHDNNRDGLQISQDLTKAIFSIYYRWHPLVMHDLHESVPLLYISTGTGPYNVDNDPILISEWQTMANNDIGSLAAQGLPGVWTWGFFDGWWPGYAIWVANNHNSVGRFFETFGNAGADTYVRKLDDERFAGEPATARTWYRPWPPTKKVRWSARDNINYMEAGVLSSLTYAADNSSKMLHDFWQIGVNSLKRGREETPHAFVIPGFNRQRDPKMVAYLVNQLLRQKIEVQQRMSGDSAGDFVVLLDQPYRDLAVNLLTKQHYPPTAQYPPYDDIAWTLGYLYGVDVNAVDDTAAFHWPGLRPVTDTVAAADSVAGAGSPAYVMKYTAQAEVLPALYWLKDHVSKARAYAAERPFTAAGDSFPAGSLILEKVPAAAAETLARAHALPLRGVAAAPDVARHPLDLPRVAIYHTWYSTQDEGWARFTFEQLGIPYTSIDKDDLRKGKLRDRFDVILVPNINGPSATMVHGIDTKWGPLAFQKTKATPALGTPASTPDMTGGPGFEGMDRLQQFVEDGGTLVTLANATRLVSETGLARPLRPHAAGRLFHPGSIVRAKAAHGENPILYGYPEKTTIFRGNAPLFAVSDRDSAMVVLEYGTKTKKPEKEGPMLGMPETSSKATKAPAPSGAAEAAGGAQAPGSAKPAGAQPPGGAKPGAAAGGAKPATAPDRGEPGAPRAAAPAAAGEDEGGNGAGDYVVSGMVRNADEIIGEGAIFDVPVGKGRVVAFTFDPLHRFLNHHEFPMVWNTLMNWNDLPEPTGEAAEPVSAGGGARP